MCSKNFILMHTLQTNEWHGWNDKKNKTRHLCKICSHIFTHYSARRWRWFRRLPVFFCSLGVYNDKRHTYPPHRAIYDISCTFGIFSWVCPSVNNNIQLGKSVSTTPHCERLSRSIEGIFFLWWLLCVNDDVSHFSNDHTLLQCSTICIHNNDIIEN